MLKIPFNLTFIGTGGIMPNKYRNFPCFLVNIASKKIFLDFGQGSQKALLSLSSSLILPDYFFISHYHLDHYYGLYSYLKTLELSGVTKKMKILLPQGNKSFEKKLREIKLDLDLITSEDSIEDEFFKLVFFKTDHLDSSRGLTVIKKERRKYTKQLVSEIEGKLLAKIRENKILVHNGVSYNYSELTEVVESEISLTYTSDTRPIDLVQTNYLIHECTYLADEESTAREKQHTSITELLNKDLSSYHRVFLVHLHPRYRFFPKLKDNMYAPRDYEVFDLNENTFY
jgi:ribonuclease Z